jgi:uncharacterized protein YlxP (DUF503 family)
MSVAEVDLQDSISFAELGAVIVSNSRSFGESIMNKALAIIENEVRVQNVNILSEEY